MLEPWGPAPFPPNLPSKLQLEILVGRGSHLEKTRLPDSLGHPDSSKSSRKFQVTRSIDYRLFSIFQTLTPSAKTWGSLPQDQVLGAGQSPLALRSRAFAWELLSPKGTQVLSLATVTVLAETHGRAWGNESVRGVKSLGHLRLDHCVPSKAPWIWQGSIWLFLVLCWSLLHPKWVWLNCKAPKDTGTACLPTDGKARRTTQNRGRLYLPSASAPCWLSEPRISRPQESTGDQQE